MVHVFFVDENAHPGVMAQRICSDHGAAPPLTHLAMMLDHVREVAEPGNERARSSYYGASNPPESSRPQGLVSVPSGIYDGTRPTGCFMGGTVRVAVSFRNRRLLGSRGSRTWVPLVVVLGAAAVVVVVALGGFWTSSSRAASEAQKSTPTAALPTSTTTSPAPAPADVDAARACSAFNSYLSQAGQGRVPKATGEALTNDAYHLLAGASQDQASGQPLPKWTNLGEYAIAAADDVVHKDSSALSKDGPPLPTPAKPFPNRRRRPEGMSPLRVPRPARRRTRPRTWR